MSISILGIYVADLVFFGKKIPVEGETILGNNFVIGPGGKGSNQAVAAAKAGVKTYFISKIGDDQFGQMATKIYDEAKVDYSNVIISKEHSTGAAAIMVNEQSGANAINVFPGAAGAITNNDIDKAEKAIKNSKIFLTQLEAPKDTVMYAIKKAKDLGVDTILNPAPAADIDKSIFPFIDYFTPNETEAEFFTGSKITNEKEAKQAADKLINLGIKKIIITLGEKGLFFSDGKEEIYMKASPVKAIDTTGAGDAFNGGLAFGLSKGKSIKECLELANKVAGISTTKLGAGNAMPYLSDI